MGKPVRLDKYLSAYTELSRKDAKKAIRSGRVLVGHQTVFFEDSKVTDEEEVWLDGEPVQAEPYVYYMMNKPSGVLSATKDARDKTVLDLIETSKRAVFPVGRLDKDTEGLLLLTDNGELSHILLSPRYHVDKVYEICYDGELKPDAVADFDRGIDIGEKHLTKPARLELLSEGKARLTISEGKFHQVKRMIAKEGGRVTYLKRIAMAGIVLDGALGPGEYRRLTENEIEILKKSGRKE